MIQSGTTLEMVQVILGHSTFDVTQRYVHLVPEWAARRSSGMGGSWGSGRSGSRRLRSPSARLLHRDGGPGRIGTSMNQLPPAPEPQRRGYLVVLRPAATAAAFRRELERSWPQASTEAIAAWSRSLDEMHRKDPLRYAGWDRAPVGRAFSARELAAWPEQRERLIAEVEADPDCVPLSLELPFSAAEHLMTERLGENPTTYWQVRFVSASVIPDHDLAHEVLSLTDEPEEREVIHLTRIDDGSDEASGPGPIEAQARPFLGFDVGFWGGPFSLISDTMVYPRWHPGTDEALPVLRQHAAVLNEHMLFPTVEAATAFRSWYRTQAWAESEGDEGDFCIARIDRA